MRTNLLPSIDEIAARHRFWKNAALANSVPDVQLYVDAARKVGQSLRDKGQLGNHRRTLATAYGER